MNVHIRIAPVCSTPDHNTEPGPMLTLRKSEAASVGSLLHLVLSAVG
jgi:hypothetical protein